MARRGRPNVTVPVESPSLPGSYSLMGKSNQWLFLTLICMDLLLLHSHGQLSSNGCNHVLWDTTNDQGVWHAKAVCQEGRIDWRHPYSALRVTFALHGSSSRAVNTCFKARALFTEAVISLEEEDSLRQLVVLNSSQSLMPRELCIAGGSSSAPLTLYIETSADTSSTALGKLEIDYDLSLTDVDVDDGQDCRPCTEAELLQAVCSSDFVVSGRIQEVQHNAITMETEIKILAKEVVRQKRSTFKRMANADALSWSPNTASASQGDQKPSVGYTGTIIVPQKCGVRHGEGEFLFMGKVRLDRAHLRCAPRMEDFEELYFRAEKEGTSFCTPK